MPIRRPSKTLGKILLALAATVFGLFLLLVGSAPFRRDTWHAELSMANLDCSQPLVCRFHPNRVINLPDATRRHVSACHTNALGYRGPLPPVERSDPRELRVFVFGDSMTLGIGVDDDQTLAQDLQRGLQAALPDRRVVVSNFGMYTTFLISNLRSYSLLARPYRPDVVVFADDRFSPRDMNQRIGELRGSAVLRWLLRSRAGADLAGRYQNTRLNLYSRGAAEAALREQFEILADDQAARGMIVAFFHYFDRPSEGLWNDAEGVARSLPARLRRLDIHSGLSLDAYQASRWPIPGDGHPTAEGQQHFADIVEAALLPALRAQAPRP